MATPLYIAAMLALMGFAGWRVRAQADQWLLQSAVVASVAALLPLVLGAAMEDFFGVVRLVAWGVFVFCPLWCIVVVPLIRSTWPRTAAGLATLALVLVAIALDAFVYEPRALEVNHYEIRTDKRDKPLRIAVIADLQTDAPGDYERTAIRRALSEKPDVILLPGDYVQGLSVAAYDQLRPALNALLKAEQFAAPLGAWAVEGNVDHGPWTEIFDGLPVEATAATRTYEGDGFKVTALSFDDSFDLPHTIGPTADFHIVFGHGPDFVLGDITADLMVAGHTHGGQVRLPLFGPPITISRIPREWAAGLTRIEAKGTLVVSRGIGMERGRAPRLRFLCKPEVVIIDVVPL